MKPVAHLACKPGIPKDTSHRSKMVGQWSPEAVQQTTMLEVKPEDVSAIFSFLKFASKYGRVCVPD